MKYIVLVGDKPSSKNINKCVPFVGTQSYKTLLNWIWHLDINITDVLLANKDDIHLWFKAAEDESRLHRHTYIALGNAASETLEQYNLSHFKLPHPSGRNRKLNDKNFLLAEFIKCKQFLIGFRSV